MKLDCLLDHCPATTRPVDMRTCCNGKAIGGKACPHYGAAPWSEFGHVTCNHPQAKAANQTEREANIQTFKSLATVGHVLYCDPPKVAE